MPVCLVMQQTQKFQRAWYGKVILLLKYCLSGSFVLPVFLSTRFLFVSVLGRPENNFKKESCCSSVISFLVFGLAIYGRVSKFPLRWSDAYRFNSDYKASLALNPFQSFFSSLKFRRSGLSIFKKQNNITAWWLRSWANKPGYGHVEFYPIFCCK